MPNTLTENYDFKKPALGDGDWHEDLNQNFDDIDTEINNVSSGGTSWSTVSKSGDYTASNYENVLTDASSSSVTITLPDVASDIMVTVKKTDSSSNAVDVDSPNSETIDGDSAPYTMTAEDESVTLTSDGSNYFIV